ncbi:energy transducer TonB [Phenylobacterium immobile]|uniref:energy transducer TonB n=1 Tax=Phenylobacterium immobile TaxID=21 RepID=UPI000A839063|nr:energy transducer TonB [Phenylobacterium immobile]
MKRVLVAASLALTSPAFAEVISQPDWIQKPTQEEMWRVVPTQAAREGVAGEAFVECRVNVEGGLHACKVFHEAPLGMGFGEAALAMTPVFRMRPLTRDGKPFPDGIVRVPIRWRIEGPMAQTGASVLRAPQWLKAPDFDQLVASYPGRAREEGAPGRVTLMCRYSKTGTLSACEVHEETPRRMGFAAAARKLSPLFQGPALSPDLQRREIKAMVNVTFPTGALKGERRVGKPTWRQLPTAADLAEVFPEAARKAGRGGSELVKCRVIADGVLQACQPIRETPQGEGFGAAAVRLAHTSRMSVWSDEGLPTAGGDVTIPFRFEPEIPSPPK